MQPKVQTTAQNHKTAIGGERRSDIGNQFSGCNKKNPAVCEVVKTDFGVAAGQNAFGKMLGQLRDSQK